MLGLVGMLVLVAVVLPERVGTASRRDPLDDSAVAVPGAGPDTLCGQSLCAILQVDDVDDIWHSPSGKIWIAGFSGGLVHWDGRRWLHYGKMGGFKSVWGSGDDDVWAVGDNVVHWDGKRWERRLSGLEGSYGVLWTVWGSGRGDVWAGGEFGRVVHWNGTRWEERPIGADGDVRVITGSSGNDVWVGTNDKDHQIARWDGRSWHAQTPLPPKGTGVCSVRSIAVAAPDSVWLADGCDLFLGDGRRWTRVPAGFHASKVVVAKGRILAAGSEEDGVTPGAWEWRADRWTPLGFEPEDRISSLDLDERGRLWIGTDGGAVMRLDP